MFLAIDHIDGGGTQHRKSTGSKYMMSWLKVHNYPPGFQTLCHNCNMAKGFYGKCPHRIRYKEKILLGDINGEEQESQGTEDESSIGLDKEETSEERADR